MENYRKIYDKDSQSKPVPGLFSVLSNAFALINDQIVDDNTRESDQKETCLNILKDLWERAQKNRDTLTSSIFQGYNRNLAHIIDCYKEQKDININHLKRSNPLAYPNWMGQFALSMQAFKQKINESNTYDQGVKKIYLDHLTKIETHFDENLNDNNFKLYGFRSISEAFEKLENDYQNEKQKPVSRTIGLAYDPNIDDMVFIIYGLPKPGKARNISESHYVKQLLKGDYSAYITFFDVLSKPKHKWSTSKENKPSRKDPHWSKENGTERLYGHDVAHVRTQISDLVDRGGREYLKKTLALQEKLETQNQNNDATILMKGLFAIIHERPDVVRDAMNTPEVKNSGTVLKFFEAIVSNFKKKIMTYDKTHTDYPLSPYGSDTYKQENRDWEFSLLRAKYAESDGSIKPVHDGQEAFLPIEYDTVQKKMTRPFNNDPNKNEKMTDALNQGYARFWTYFLSIIEKHLNE
jgi:hypothetical protein